MTADQNFYDMRFMFFYPTASFASAEYLAESENCAYGPTL